MNFGLGLVLSFTDNASTGINNAVNSLDRLTSVAEGVGTSLEKTASLSALSVVAGQLGDSFLSAGTTIISSMGQVMKTITDTGQTLMFADKQLSALYASSGKSGKEVIGQIQKYAKSSMFEFENLIPAVTSLKSVGIEAFDSITSSMGNSKNNLLDYASALASFAPQMRNAYGTGINAAIGSMREYIAEGNALSLKRGAGLDITQILGEDKGKSIEDRTRQVADLIEKLGMLGMVDAMKDNPMTQLSNMKDTLFQLKGMIAEDGGVYKKFSELVGKLAGYINSIPDDELLGIAKNIGSALVFLMSPVEKIIDGVISLTNWLRKLLANNPNMIKFVAILTSFAGGGALIIGVILKVTSAFSGLSLMMLTMGKSFGSIGGILGAGMLKILAVLIPLTIAIGLMYLAWKTDFANIRTNVKAFVSGITLSFQTAKSSVNGSVEDLLTTISKLNKKNDFFSGLTLNLMKLMIIFRAVSEGWNNNTLSEDTFLKARELGVLPLIEAILDLKYRFGFFKQGFLDGWDEIGNKVRRTVEKLTSTLNGTIFESLTDRLTEFLQIFSGSDVQKWYDFGKSFAGVTARAVAFFGIFTLGKKAVTIVGGLFNVLKPLVGLIVANPIVALIVAVVVALGILYAKSEKFRDLVSNIVENIKSVVGSAIAEIKPLIETVFNSIRDILPEIGASFGSVFKELIPIIEAIGKFGLSLLPTLGKVIGSIINVVISLLPTIMNMVQTIGNILGVVFRIIRKLLDMVLPFLSDIYKKLGDLISDVLPLIANLFKELANAVMDVIAVLLPSIESIFNALAPILETVFNIVRSIFAKVVPIIKSIIGIVINIVSMIIAILRPIISIVVTIVTAIIKVLAPIVNVILQIAGFIIDVVLGIVQVIVSIIEFIVSLITGIVKVIMSIIEVIVNIYMGFFQIAVGIVTSIINAICSIIGGIIDVIQFIWDFIINTFSNAVGFFSDIFSSVSNVICNIFRGIATFFKGIWEGIMSVFDTIGDVISKAVRGAINTVLTFATNVINGFIKAINLAIGVINAIPGVEIKKLTYLNVPALATGGVVDKPTTALIGEAGKEAVVPLEKNLGWISKIASMITSKMNYGDSSRLIPTNTNTEPVDANKGEGRYLTTTNTNNTQTLQGNTDNSVTFAEGSIVMNVQNASDEEAMRFAKKVMELIKRQKEIDEMVQYA